MADTINPESFEEIVEWAYRTLPQKIRKLPDFPGIQVVDEPPAEVLDDISNRKKWPLEARCLDCTVACIGQRGSTSR